MPPADPRGWDRTADLDAIRDTYEEYDRTGRGRIWTEESPGFGRLSRDIHQEVVAVLKRSMPRRGATVLDVGCGTGDLIGLAERSSVDASWIGVDLREVAIDIARERYPSARFIACSADDIPLSDMSAEVVVAQVLFSSLPSVQLEAAVAREIGRVLRPGGWLVWLDLRYSNPFNPAVHGIGTGRLAALFPGWPMEVRTAGLLPPLARKLGGATPWLYPLLSGVSPLRSHLVGRLRRPDVPLTV